MTADPDPAVAEDGGAGAALSTGAVARRLGVAPTTLRSWEHRYAIGPATRQDGKHRRWTPQDIARLEEMCRLTSQGVPPAEAARAVLRPHPRPQPGLRRLCRHDTEHGLFETYLDDF
ncbi:MerR family transcriptional regulator, partial [Streptomyces altiplanensis]